MRNHETTALTPQQIEQCLEIVIPWFAVLPAGEWRHLGVKSGWPETLFEHAIDYAPEVASHAKIRLSTNQVKAVEECYRWLRLIDDKKLRAIVYFKNHCRRPEIANEILARKFHCTTRSVQRWYAEGLLQISSSLEKSDNSEKTLVALVADMACQ